MTSNFFKTGLLLFLPAVMSTSHIPARAASHNAPQLIEPGLFDGVPGLRSGPGWLGLLRTGKSACRLKRVTIVVARVPRPDDPAADKIDKVSADSGLSPIFLVKGLALRPGLLATTFGSTAADADANKSLQLGRRRYQLRDVPQRLPDGERRAKVTLSFGGRTQTLFPYPARDSALLQWAGDADGDGKLDLYLNISGHNYHTEGMLFLSSQAKPGQLVGEAAHWSGQMF